MLIPAAFWISASDSVSPSTVSSTPQTVKTPPMMRRRSKRFAARSARVSVLMLAIPLPQHHGQDRGAEEDACAHYLRRVARLDALVLVRHAVDQALQFLDRLRLGHGGHDHGHD